MKSQEKVELKKWPTTIKPIYKSKENYEEILGDHVKELSKLQNLLYASNRHSVLLIFQAMDAAGKDSAIKHVMSGINPQVCQVFSFKHPSAEELEYDFYCLKNFSTILDFVIIFNTIKTVLGQKKAR